MLALVSATGTTCHFVPTISLKPMSGILPNLHGYIMGTSQRGCQENNTGLLQIIRFCKRVGVEGGGGGVSNIEKHILSH